MHLNAEKFTHQEIWTQFRNSTRRNLDLKSETVLHPPLTVEMEAGNYGLWCSVDSDNGLFSWTAPSHYLNQCWDIIDWILRNKLQWNFNQNSYIFIQENAFKLSSGKCRPFCLGLNVLNGAWIWSSLRLQMSHQETQYWLKTWICFPSSFAAIQWFCDTFANRWHHPNWPSKSREISRHSEY